jgi:hypothetical protein
VESIQHYSPYNNENTLQTKLAGWRISTLAIHRLQPQQILAAQTANGTGN